MKPKIFEFNFNPEKDWVIATGLEEAKSFYVDHIGGIESDLDGCEITEIPEYKWSDLTIFDPDDTEPEKGEYSEDDYACGYKIIATFKEIASKYTSPDIIATTEY